MRHAVVIAAAVRGSVCVLSGGQSSVRNETWMEHAEERDGYPGAARADSLGTLRETLARYEQAHVEHNGELLRSCFHDDALIESVASDGDAARA